MAIINYLHVVAYEQYVSVERQSFHKWWWRFDRNRTDYDFEYQLDMTSYYHINDKHPDNCTAMMYKNNCFKIGLAFLIQCISKINDTSDIPALFLYHGTRYSVRLGHHGMIMFMLNNTSHNAFDRFYVAISHAIYCGQTDVFKLIMSLYNKHQYTFFNFNSLLAEASYCGKLDIVKFIIENYSTKQLDLNQAYMASTLFYPNEVREYLYSYLNNDQKPK